MKCVHVFCWTRLKHAHLLEFKIDETLHFLILHWLIIVLATSLTEAPVEQPDHIKIEGIRLPENTAQETQDSLPHELQRTELYANEMDTGTSVAQVNNATEQGHSDTFITPDNNTTVQGDTSSFTPDVDITKEQDTSNVTHDNNSSQKNCQSLELVLNEAGQNESDTEDHTELEASDILTLGEKPVQRIISVQEALEAIRNMEQSDEEKATSLTQNPDDTQLDSAVSTVTEHKIYVTGKKCPLCKQSFHSNAHALQHIEKDHKDITTEQKQKLTKKVHCQEQCNICGKLYRNAYNLRTHMEVMHTTHVQAQCPMCGIKVKNKKTLAGHIKRIHEQVEPKYLCHLCPASFRVQNYLNGHLKTVHSKLPKDVYSCDKCDYKTPFEKYMRLHKSRVHEERKFHCTVCERKFSSKSNLKRHIDCVHTEAEHLRYPCDVCDKTFSTKGNLKHHYEKAHLQSLKHEKNIAAIRESQLFKVYNSKEVSKGVDVTNSLDGYLLFDIAPS